MNSSTRAVTFLQKVNGPLTSEGWTNFREPSEWMVERVSSVGVAGFIACLARQAVDLLYGILFFQGRVRRQRDDLAFLVFAENESGDLDNAVEPELRLPRWHALGDIRRAFADDAEDL